LEERVYALKLKNKEKFPNRTHKWDWRSGSLRYFIPHTIVSNFVVVFLSPCTWTLSNLITIQVRTPLFWIITHRVVVIPYQSFGTTYRSLLQVSRIQRGLNSWHLKMGSMGYRKGG
jgi:hypothetical protein